MTTYVCTFDTPLPAGGASRPVSFSLAVNEAGAVVATAFGGVDEVRSRTPLGTLVPDDVRTGRAREQVLAYFRGESAGFSVALDPKGSAFQKRVWRELQQIPIGLTRSYGEIARALDSSARAVGRANATNPVCLLIPCHRVIGANGKLTGFAFGEAIKAALLAHERTFFGNPAGMPELSLTGT